MRMIATPQLMNVPTTLSWNDVVTKKFHGTTLLAKSDSVPVEGLLEWKSISSWKDPPIVGCMIIIGRTGQGGRNGAGFSFLSLGSMPKVNQVKEVFCIGSGSPPEFGVW